MHDAVITYLQDHLTGSRGALELLEYLGEHAEDAAFRLDAPALTGEFQDERQVLEGLVSELGGEGLPLLKEVGAWMGEKLSRLKLGGLGGAVQGLPLFEAVEALVLGIRGKIALWDALETVAEENDAFPRRAFAALREQGLAQFARMETHRLRLARQVLAPGRFTAAD